jgi:hypothetical protein
MELFETANPGEPAPQVDPEDLKTVWEYIRQCHEAATGIELFKHLCKPGADIWAVVEHNVILYFLLDKVFALVNFGTLVG